MDPALSAVSPLMMELPSNKYDQMQAPAEFQRGAFPLGLPNDGMPRSEAFSQLVDLKSVRTQRKQYPQPCFDAALQLAAANGLDCYRCLRRSFHGLDHIPIALVPRASNVVVAHLPAVFSRAADAVLTLGHRLYFEVDGTLRIFNVHEDDEGADDGNCGQLLHERGFISRSNCGSRSLNGSSSRPTEATRTSLMRTRSGNINGSRGFSGRRSASWMPSTSEAGSGGGSYAAGNATGGRHEADLQPARQNGVGAASYSTSFSTVSSLQSQSSMMSSASSSLRTLRSVLSSRYASSRMLQFSQQEIEVADPDIGECDDDKVALVHGGRLNHEKLSLTITVFADGEEGAQAFRYELVQRGYNLMDTPRIGHTGKMLKWPSARDEQAPGYLGHLDT